MSVLSSRSSEMLWHGKHIPKPKHCVWVQTKLATTSGNIILGRQVIMCLKQQREKTKREKEHKMGKTIIGVAQRTSHHNNISSMWRMYSSQSCYQLFPMLKAYNTAPQMQIFRYDSIVKSSKNHRVAMFTSSYHYLQVNYPV